LQFEWNRPNHLDATDLLQLADLLDGEVGLAGDEPLGGKPLLDDDGARVDLGRDAQLLVSFANRMPLAPSRE
jgi:hypothetical protein